MSVKECAEAAARLGSSVFAVQNGSGGAGQCFVARGSDNWTKYGAAPDPGDAGGPWINTVYRIDEAGFPDAGSYVHVGCYKDDFSRDFTDFAGEGLSLTQCARAARANGSKYFALQDGRGQCFHGNSYGKYGAVQCTGNQNQVGGQWVNTVYKLQ